jgi:hypothetical protein
MLGSRALTTTHQPEAGLEPGLQPGRVQLSIARAPPGRKVGSKLPTLVPRSETSALEPGWKNRQRASGRGLLLDAVNSFSCDLQRAV